MKVRILALAAAVVLAVPACGHSEAGDEANAATSGAPTATASVAVKGQEFANRVAANDAFEIASSNLAARRSQSAAIKAFAAKMVQDHTQATARLKALGTRVSITPDPALTPDERQQLDALKGKMGADFDRAYVADQIGAHQRALDLLNQYVTNGDVHQFRTYAGNHIPVMSGHLLMAKDLKP